MPVEVRKKLGVEPGAELEWEEKDGQIVVRRAGGSTWEEVRRALFPEGPPPPITVEQMNEVIGDAIAEDDQRILSQSREPKRARR